MANLNNKIRIYLEENSKTKDELLNNIILQNDSDGNGDYIKTWNVSGLAQPTDEQLNALESEADDLETANQVISNRKSEYPSIEECVHAILDDDLENLQILRQAVKEKFPKNE